MSMFKKYMSDKRVERSYISSGTQLVEKMRDYGSGYADMRHLIDVFGDWENEYARRGYRTLPLDDLIKHHRDKKSIAPLLRVRCAEREEPTYHAAILRANYLSNVFYGQRIKEFMDEAVSSGIYDLSLHEM